MTTRIRTCGYCHSWECAEGWERCDDAMRIEAEQAGDLSAPNSFDRRSPRMVNWIAGLLLLAVGVWLICSA